MDSRQELKSLKKGLRTLTFLNQRGDATVSEVAKAVGVPRPTAYRILESLASEGYVEKQMRTGLYRLTSMVRGLAAGFQDEELLIERAKPIISRFSKELGWPIALSTPRGAEMVVRTNTDYECALALDRFNVGFAAPMLHSTCGYSYLAHCPETERDEILTAALAREQARETNRQSDVVHYLKIKKDVGSLTPFDKSRYDEISYLLDVVRHHGFCNIEFTQYREGNVGVPVFLRGKPIGGLVMRYIKSVMKNTERIHKVYAPRLQQLSRDVTDAYLGHAPRPDLDADVHQDIEIDIAA